MIVYLPDDNQEHIEVLKAFSLGVDCEIRNIHDYAPSDIAVIFGMYKRNIPVSFPRGKIFNNQKALGKTTIVVEKGYINREEYYAIGLNGLNNRAEFNNSGMGSDRWDKLGVDLRSQKGGDYTLVCGQVPSDASVQNVDIHRWAKSMINRIEGEVVYRPHPLYKKTRPLEEDLEGAKAVVTYNSNIGVDAALRGIPVYAEDIGSMVYDIASQDVDNIGKMDTKQWAKNIAYAQWNLEEMRNGLPWEHLNEYKHIFGATDSGN